MKSSDDWPLEGKPLAWKPPGGTSSLAVPLFNNEQEISWDEYLDRLKIKVAWMSRQHKNPVSVLEREWDERVGGIPALNKPEELVDNLDFQELMQERYNVRQSQFPQPVTNQPSLIEEIKNSDLELWMMDFAPRLAD